MPRGIGVAVHRGPMLREPPGSTGVVEVNVGDKDLLDCRFIDTDLTDRRTQRFQRGARPRFDQRELTAALNEIRSDESGSALETEIERVDAHEGTKVLPSFSSLWKGQTNQSLPRSNDLTKFRELHPTLNLEWST